MDGDKIDSIFTPGQAIPAKCQKCNADFESTAIVIMGQEKWRTKWCAACLASSDEEFRREEQEKLKKDAMDLRRQEFNEVCPPLYRNTDVNHPAINQKALQQVMAWENKRDGVGLAIRGESGRCKTRMAYLLLEKLHMAGRCTTFAITATRLASLCAEIYDDTQSATAHRTNKKVRGCSYLLIDDLGKQKFTERAETELYDLIEHRTANLLPTFWTANVTSDAFAAMMSADRGTPIIRRLSEFSTVISL